jgi:hypothetical protein
MFLELFIILVVALVGKTAPALQESADLAVERAVLQLEMRLAMREQ